MKNEESFVPKYQIGYFGITILMIVYMFSMLDRQIVNILVESIKEDLNISDKQIGILTGLSFAVFYTSFGIPLARLSERSNRSHITAACLIVWSLFTIGSGAARNFVTLVIVRMGVGMGEAGCLPAAHSMIAEYVPQTHRARAISIFMMGAPLGILLGMAVGGIAADIYGWRAAFFIAGAPGILLALLVLYVIKDPNRAKVGSSQISAPSFLETFRSLYRKKGYWLLTLGAALGAFVTVAQGAFIASFYLRNHSLAIEETSTTFGSNATIGIILGLILGIGGAVGTMAGGILADMGGGGIRRYVRVCSLSCLLVGPVFLAAIYAPDLGLSLTLLVPAAILNAVWAGPAFAVIPSLSHPRSRATAAALALMIISLVSLGLGPIAIGSVSDWFGNSQGSAEGLRTALALSTIVSILAAGMFRFADRACEADYHETQD